MTDCSYLYSLPCNCVTGDTDHLYEHLKIALSKATKIDIIVAFIMESGVRLLEQDLKEAAERGAYLRILCGNYLNITQPSALYLLKNSLEEKVDLRFYNVPGKSFHPKAYIFEFDDEDEGEIYIGSSNISRSALTSGIEWNYRITPREHKEDYYYFKKAFEGLFLNKSIIVDDYELRKYSKNWRRPKVFEDLEKLEDADKENIGSLTNVAEETDTGYIVDRKNKIIEYPRPIGAQIEALYELKKNRLDGADKGLVVAATGVGKTFLAAFDSKPFNSILFIAHREEILFQAERTFKCVRSEAETGFFSGSIKDTECDILFATVQTLGRDEYLTEEWFPRNRFEYIIIDEFHHAVASSYRNILEYFEPKFLLGLTATPERLDNQDVFSLCDYNLVYEVRLREAINKGWLVPFRYYGIYDTEIDYSNIPYNNGRYDEKELEKALSINKRADLILNHYLKYDSKSALGFCSSRGHAVFMADYFNENGVKACAVISGSCNDKNSLYIIKRDEAVKKLKKGEIKVIFSVDMFNEGLDIPLLDLVMFLRPTESPTVFLQQLGRGLRKSGKKTYLNVLDFIGNYRKANLVPFFLTGDVKDYGNNKRKIYLPREEDYPDGCIVNFDFRLIDLFKRMADQQVTIKDRIREEYFKIKDKVGTAPSRLNMFTYMDQSVYEGMRRISKLNVFRDYLSFLGEMGDLTEEERAIIGTLAHEFIKTIENTSMTKTYKMPILLAFYNNGNIKLAIDDNDIYESFKIFYSKGSNAIDMLKDKGTSSFMTWGKKEYVSLARRNPVHFLSHSAPEFFYQDNNLFCPCTRIGGVY